MVNIITIHNSLTSKGKSMFLKTLIFTVIISLLAIGIYSVGLMDRGILEAGQEIRLPEPARDGEMSVEKAISQRRSTRSFRDEPITLDQVSQILWAAQGITEEQRKFRAAPSAGATYPLEVFLLSCAVEGLEPAVFRYVPDGHSLSKVVDGDKRQDLYAQALRQPSIINAPAVLVIGGDFARTTRRYGSRGEQYVFMEVGHVGQNIQLQAESLGLSSVVIGAFDDSGVQKVLGLPKDLTPFYIIPMGK
jgi:SagB-type dehydrogenase family enzyme